MALLPVSRRPWMSGALAALALMTGCFQTALVKVSLPMDPLRHAGTPMRGGPDGSRRVVLLAGAATRCSGFRPGDVGALQRSLAAAFKTTGYEVVEPAGGPTGPLSPVRARRIAQEAGADALIWVEPTHLRIQRSVHHIHEYHDGSASGRVQVLKVGSWLLLKTAGERVYLSTRVRYSSEDYARDVLLNRLAAKLARSLLYEETRYFVELEDPSPGLLRRGIDLAREGRWAAAIDDWEMLLEGGKPSRLAPAIHYDLGIALALSGRREEALRHLETALEGEPESPRYRKVFGRVEEEGWPWESR